MKKPAAIPAKTFIHYEIASWRTSENWPLMSQIHERVQTARALGHRVEVIATKEQLTFCVLVEKP